MKYQNLNAIALAYLGDAIYEVYIRKHLIDQGKTRPNDLHKTATRYVSAKAQAKLIQKMRTQHFLSAAEENIYLRGRNAKPHTKAKNTDWATYSRSTGFEAVIGFLYLTKENARLKDFITWCIKES